MESVNKIFPNVFFFEQTPKKAIAAPFFAVTMTSSGKPDHTKAPSVFTSTKAIWCHCFLSHQFSPMFHNGQSSILAVWSPLNGVYSASTDDNIEQYNERSSCDAKMRYHTFLLPTINFTDEVKDFCWWKHSDLLYFCTLKKAEAQKKFPANFTLVLPHVQKPCIDQYF